MDEHAICSALVKHHVPEEPMARVKCSDSCLNFFAGTESCAEACLAADRHPSKFWEFGF
jgi:hypothetical protein